MKFVKRITRYNYYLNQLWLRNLVNKIINIFLPKSADCHVLCKNDVDKLRKDGFVFLDNVISDLEIELFKEHYLNAKLYDPWSKTLEIFSSRNPLKGTHTGQVLDPYELVEVFRIANNPRILSIVGHYFGCKPTLDNIQLWWSFPGNENPEEAENFHRDWDSFKWLKLFIYLTDVDEESGPHVFYRGSHKWSSHMEHRRFRDDEFLGFETSRVEFTGKKGTAFLEDTFGIHKGQLPKSKSRLLLQVRYTNVPSIFSNDKFKLANRNDYDEYINRLFYA